MITRILLYIKHNLKLFWRIIEWTNGVLFKYLYLKRFETVIPEVLRVYGLKGLEFRVLASEDLKQLSDLISRQNTEDLAYFRPHDFDRKSLESLNSSGKVVHIRLRGE